MPHEELYNRIFSNHADAAGKREMLERTVTEFPYFTPAHFFLLSETPFTHVEYRKTASKTALHFNNPFLLKYQLNKKLKPVEVPGNEEKNQPESSQVNEDINNNDQAKISGESGNENLPVENATPANQNKNEENKTPPANKKEELLFEPLYTTDYFASQGIRLGEEVNTNDKLGKQLKSFTDWLKTMKKVQHGKLPEGNPNIDLAVQNLAEKSNKEEEVLTESMAEVYLKQGKAGKAKDIYKKLSLLNPAKSAYFAAKIELLKEN